MRTVTFIREIGRPETDHVTVKGVRFDRLKPVFVDNRFYAQDIASLWAYDFDVHESLVCEYRPQKIRYSDRLYTGDITVIIPNYKTRYHTRIAVESFKAAYPDLPMIVTDDGSQDESTKLVASLPLRYDNVQAMIFDHNIGHGDCLHKAIERVETSLFLTMDSDCIVHRGGWLEQMETRLHQARLYAIGVLYQRDWAEGNHRVLCVVALHDTAIYRRLPPFATGPHPMADNMAEAQRLGIPVECYPIFDDVTHLEAASRRPFTDDFARWDFREKQEGAK